ncbi:MAG TPA: phosphoribosylaminoimidazolecarboxamide formyltransferase [Thermoclostridium sp.]|jgi:phosphoribosylaminoimidazolecarboxamide formyltransferase/IMP cyclohydrolase|nr:phosphoribosylaminoimidazolecarboxamide formyltransferase [Clostridiaceae bacterium]HOQ76637.1 phosphoribosylaminoimidazolecarboxamide formyltransferase [Thermoclostridium sp.]
MRDLQLKYGCNPHQKPASIYMKEGELPVTVLNGNPSLINFMDALNGWQLVKELRTATGLPAAASFKHVSPAGAAVGLPLSDTLKKAYHIEKDRQLSPVACAYARARGADRVSSFGDFAAISDKVDLDTARLLSQEVSDGVIAPDYDNEALEILKAKKKGSYVIMRMDPGYEPAEMEARDIYGITVEQKRNNAVISKDTFSNIVTENKTMPDAAVRDLLVSFITLKYTQSNSICFAYDGQVIGCGAGQQSRIHCTRLAASKADIWFLRQHPQVLGLRFKEGLKRPEIDNAIDLYLRDDISEMEYKEWEKLFEVVPEKLTQQEKGAWLSRFTDVSYGSDAFIPFRDNIDRAAKSGVVYVAQAGGSTRDEDVIRACNEYGMVMCFTGLRLFHH